MGKRQAQLWYYTNHQVIEFPHADLANAPKPVATSQPHMGPFLFPFLRLGPLILPTTIVEKDIAVINMADMITHLIMQGHDKMAARR